MKNNKNQITIITKIFDTEAIQHILISHGLAHWLFDTCKKKELATVHASLISLQEMSNHVRAWFKYEILLNQN